MKTAGDAERERVHRFIGLYNQLDAYLRQITGAPPGVPFWRVVEQAVEQNASVKAFVQDIRQLGFLRNAIIHDIGYPESAIAVPTAEPVERRSLPRMYAVVITDSGAAEEEPIGIVTPWDLIG